MGEHLDITSDDPGQSPGRLLAGQFVGDDLDACTEERWRSSILDPVQRTAAGYRTDADVALLRFVGRA